MKILSIDCNKNNVYRNEKVVYVSHSCQCIVTCFFRKRTTSVNDRLNGFKYVKGNAYKNKNLLFFIYEIEIFENVRQIVNPAENQVSTNQRGQIFDPTFSFYR